ncbi:hypothetical protein BDP27DRAFT_1337245 [Rhodocollybia butyracea]|uniref:Protein kinase domain-containing protein n=1 Tax=Rhodocollybia butyracea TaxID=206335 RepID=A0A9P5U0L8_9AGAR|nr:hypothetical protein BDP27DRAFT_1337245 [Rhodocollybia butyracea]
MSLSSLLEGEPWAGRGDVHPIELTSAVCGFTEEEFGALPIRTLLEVLDRTLPGLFSLSKSTGSAPESKASQRLPKACKLVGVGSDPSWVDDAIDLFLISLEIDQLKKCDRWNKIELSLDTIIQYPGVKETNEAAVDTWGTKVTTAASVINRMIRKPSHPLHGYILTVSQPSTAVLGGGTVRPDLVSAFGRASKVFERREHKALRVNVSHSEELEELTGNFVDVKGTASAWAIIKQAYTSNVEIDRKPIPVWLGHPGLYRIAYILNNTLYMSRWRSSDPARMATVLSTYHRRATFPPIDQGHFILETLALLHVSLSMDEFMQGRSAKRIDPSGILARVQMVFVHVTEAIYSIFERLYRTKITVDGQEVYGDLQSFSSEKLELDFPRVLKTGKVWENDRTVAKLVNNDELSALKELRNVPGIPLLLGTLYINSLGLTIAFMENVGECLEEYEPMDSAVISELKKILTTIHDHGWHHHDVDHAPNFVKSKPGSYFVVDYGAAERVPTGIECTLGQECPDLLFLTEISDTTAVTIATDETLFETSPASCPNISPKPK